MSNMENEEWQWAALPGDEVELNIHQDSEHELDSAANYVDLIEEGIGEEEPEDPNDYQPAEYPEDDEEFLQENGLGIDDADAPWDEGSAPEHSEEENENDMDSHHDIDDLSLNSPSHDDLEEECGQDSTDQENMKEESEEDMKPPEPIDSTDPLPVPPTPKSERSEDNAACLLHPEKDTIKNNHLIDSHFRPFPTSRHHISNRELASLNWSMAVNGLYINFGRLSTRSDLTKSEVKELGIIVPKLRNYLLCTVCGQLLSADLVISGKWKKSCGTPHPMCKECKGEPFTIHCSYCTEIPNVFEENEFLRLVLRSYKNLCVILLRNAEWRKLVAKMTAVESDFDGKGLIGKITEGAEATIDPKIKKYFQELGATEAARLIDLKSDSEEMDFENENIPQNGYTTELQAEVPNNTEQRNVDDTGTATQDPIGRSSEEPSEHKSSEEAVKPMPLISAPSHQPPKEVVKPKVIPLSNTPLPASPQEVATPVSMISSPLSQTPQEVVKSIPLISTPVTQYQQEVVKSIPLISTPLLESRQEVVKSVPLMSTPLPQPPDIMHWPEIQKVLQYSSGTLDSHPLNNYPNVPWHPPIVPIITELNASTSFPTAISVSQPHQTIHSQISGATPTIIGSSVNNVQLPRMHATSTQSTSTSTKLPRKNCRCGNAAQVPGKLTCCGQRCPCYVDRRSCVGCKCKGCRNPHLPGGAEGPSTGSAKNIPPSTPHTQTSVTTINHASTHVFQPSVLQSHSTFTPVYSTTISDSITTGYPSVFGASGLLGFTGPVQFVVGPTLPNMPTMFPHPVETHPNPHHHATNIPNYSNSSS